MPNTEKYKVDGKIDGHWFSNTEPVFDTAAEAEAYGASMVENRVVEAYRVVTEISEKNNEEDS